MGGGGGSEYPISVLESRLSVAKGDFDRPNAEQPSQPQCQARAQECTPSLATVLGPAMQCNAVQCRAMQCNAVQCVMRTMMGVFFWGEVKNVRLYAIYMYIPNVSIT